MTNLSGLTLAAPVPVAGLASDVTLDSIAQGSDITTNNVTINKHGLCPKLPSDATKYLDGTGAYSVPAGGGGGGVTQLSYVEFTSSVNITATTESGATTIVTAAAVTVGGSTLIRVDFYAPFVTPGTADFLIVDLFQDSASIGRIFASQTISQQPIGVQSRYLTPAAGTYTYSVRGWRGSQTAVVGAGSGSSTTYMPGFIRVTSGS